MNRLNEKYGRITFGFLLLSMISFPPMTIYLLYKIVRNTNIDTQDNYLSIKKCAKCFVYIPTIFLIIGLLFDKRIVADYEIYLTMGIYYGIYAVVFFRRASNMKYYHEYALNLHAQTVSYVATPEKEEIYEEEDKDMVYKVVVCESCGAKKQIIIGRKEKCEYCDSPLEA